MMMMMIHWMKNINFETPLMAELIRWSGLSRHNLSIMY